MSNVEKEYLVLAEADAERKTDSPRADSDRLSRLPLDALLYYVLYGDEALTRLTSG